MKTILMRQGERTGDPGPFRVRVGGRLVRGKTGETNTGEWPGLSTGSS